jgi:hypothetical protein
MGWMQDGRDLRSTANRGSVPCRCCCCAGAADGAHHTPAICLQVCHASEPEAWAIAHTQVEVQLKVLPGRKTCC